jgi:hypothetical protein
MNQTVEGNLEPEQELMSLPRNEENFQSVFQLSHSL